MNGKNAPKRGEIYWVDLNPTIGHETNKKRPGLIVSNNIANEVSSLVMVAPITSKIKNVYPFEVPINLEGKQAKIMLNQMRAVDISRLKGKMSEVTAEIMRKTEDAIKIVLGLN